LLICAYRCGGNPYTQKIAQQPVQPSETLCRRSSDKSCLVGVLRFSHSFRHPCPILAPVAHSPHADIVKGNDDRVCPAKPPPLVSGFLNYAERYFCFVVH